MNDRRKSQFLLKDRSLLDMTTEEFFNKEISNVPSYRGTIPKKVFVIDQWFDVTSWPEVKYVVYNKVLGLNPDINILGNGRISGKHDFRRAKRLQNGRYIEVELNADLIASHCVKILSEAGFNASKDLSIEVVKKIKSSY